MVFWAGGVCQCEWITGRRKKITSKLQLNPSKIYCYILVHKFDILAYFLSFTCSWTRVLTLLSTLATHECNRTKFIKFKGEIGTKRKFRCAIATFGSLGVQWAKTVKFRGKTRYLAAIQYILKIQFFLKFFLFLIIIFERILITINYNIIISFYIYDDKK